MGLIRTLFSLMVMTYHLFYRSIPLGIYPVFGFYIISGYLMTLIMHESYGHTWSGRYSFLINRFLRLYPQYWTAATISIILIYLLGSDTVKNYRAAMVLPITVSQYLNNIFIAFVGWNPSLVNPKLVPPAWSLTVEILFYILICLGISKSFTRVKVWFSLSIFYVIISFILGFSWEDRYFPFLAASLPFAVGSSIYFISRDERVYSAYLKLRISPTIILLLILVNCLVFTQFEFNTLIATVDNYINLGLCALFVYSIVKGGKIIGVSDDLDKIIGNFSYPIYLLHWQTGLVVSYLLYGRAFHEFTFQGFVVWLVSLFVIFFMSLIFINILDKPVQKIRSRIKDSKA